VLAADQVAIVTGASGAIGSAIARALAQRGVRLCLVGRDVKALEAVARDADEHSEHVSIHKTDLAVDNDVDRLVTEVRATHGGVDLLVHAAGVILPNDMIQASVHDFDRQYRVNVRAPYLLTQRLLPMLIERRGQIVFVNSSVAMRAKAGVAQYVATKHALKAIADCLRDEVNPSGVRVISVFPGQTAGPMQERLYAVAEKVYVPERLLQPADVAEVVVSALSLPSSAEVTDVAVRPMLK
jgi:NADP-dependent 3-hydroxy acid dehydrogenase YdfG